MVLLMPPACGAMSTGRAGTFLLDAALAGGGGLGILLGGLVLAGSR
jgi:hypothetical protein